MRKAAASWEEEYAAKLEAVGFARGKSAPTVFYNKVSGLRLVVHGDDFTFSGVERELRQMKKKMEEWYEVKFRGILGSGKDDAKEVAILGRTARWTEDGIEYYADDRHRVELMNAEG